MSELESNPAKPQPFEGEISFDYVKADLFRVIHVDGISGGVTPNARYVQMAIFSERHPIPKKEVFNISGGKMGDKISSKSESRDSIFREVESELIMDIEVAKSIRDWLNKVISNYEQVLAIRP